MIARILAGLINFFTGIVSVFLGLRIILRLFGANPDVAFVGWIYETSGVLLQPFRGIFPSAELARGIVIDFSALFALIVYGLAGLLLISLINYLSPREVVATKRR